MELLRSARTPRFAVVAVAAVVLATTLCLGCNDDGDDLILTPVCITYTSSPPPRSPLAARIGPGTTCNRLVLEIVAQQPMADVFSLALDLEYPLVGALDVSSITPAPVWTQDGHDIIPVYDEEPLGSLTLGISRQAPPSTGFDVGAGDVLVTLSFAQAAGSGSGPLTFVSGRLQDASIPPATIAEVEQGTIVGTIAIVQQ